MKTWNNQAKAHSSSSRSRAAGNRFTAAVLVFAMLFGVLGGVASAADETVNSVYITPSTQTSKLYVDDNSLTLTAYADIANVSSDRDVTADATWTSSSTSVKVVKGVVTASGAVNSATITARYNSVSSTFYVTSEYAYDSLKLKQGSADAPDSLTPDLGPDVVLTAFGVTGGSESDVSSSATWTSSATSVATVENGTVKLLAEGTATITAKYKGRTDTVKLTVNNPYESISLYDGSAVVDGPLEMYIGNGAKSLIAKAELKSGGEDPVITSLATWTSSNAAIAKVDANGNVTPVGTGTAIITAKRFGVSDAVTVIVRNVYEALKISPDKAINVALNGAPVSLTASAAKDGKFADVTSSAEWKISDADQAVAMIAKSGDGKSAIVTPKGVGSATVTVTYNGLFRSLSVTVFPTLEKLEIGKDSLDAFVGDSATLPTVTGTTLSGETKDVSKLVQWTVVPQAASADAAADDSAVLSIEDGKWKALKEGTVTLRTAVDNGSNNIVSDTFVVNVHNKILTLIPSVDNVSVVIGKEVSLPTVKLIYENGDEATITDQIVWKSSTANLLVKTKTMKGLLPATATLTGTYLGKTVKVKVTVEEEFVSFDISPKSVSVTLNRSQTIKVTATTKSGKKVSIGSRIDWNPSSEGIVTVNGSSVKGLAEGSGKLTAKVQEKTLEVPYVVTAKLTKLTASLTSVKLATGGEQSVSLTAAFENGKTSAPTTLAAWTTSKASVATVEDGKITAKGKGTATIKAAFGGKTVTIRVTVK
ncbi:Ig domain-containing protein [Cohnella suwonensis]|uniref:Ig domain-containing protein n=1 Tax=Cohnella suwonensis TaxID=696072 RepID=A0ABW0M1Y8_9BACL